MVDVLKHDEDAGEVMMVNLDLVGAMELVQNILRQEGVNGGRIIEGANEKEMIIKGWGRDDLDKMMAVRDRLKLHNFDVDWEDPFDIEKAGLVVKIRVEGFSVKPVCSGRSMRHTWVIDEYKERHRSVWGRRAAGVQGVVDSRRREIFRSKEEEDFIH